MRRFRKRFNRRGIELSINFLVTLIISVVVFSLGLGLAYKMFTSADTMNQGIDRQNQDQLLQLLGSGERFVIPFNNAIVPVGQTHTYWMGVMNTQPVANNFAITATCSSFAPDSGGVGNCPAAASGITVKTKVAMKNIATQSSSQAPVVVVVSKDAIVGTYIIDVSLTATPSGGGATVPYDTKKKIYVEVP